MDQADHPTQNSRENDPVGDADSDFVAGFEAISEPTPAQSPIEAPSERPLESTNWTPPDAPTPTESTAFAGERGGEDLPDFTPPNPGEALTHTPESPVSESGDDSTGNSDAPHARGRAIPAPTAENMNIENLDRTMAGEIDDLLQGDAGIVDDVLQGLHDEGIEAAASDDAPHVAPDHAPPPSAPVEPPAAEPAESFESFETFESIDESLDEDLSVTTPKRIISTEPMVAARPETALAINKRPEQHEKTEEPEKMRLLPPAPVRLIIRVLRIMNAPLRLVPQRLRLVVDLIALTLIFWVPIVWAIALFVIGR